MDHIEEITYAIRLAEDGCSRLRYSQKNTDSPFFNEELYEAWDKLQAAAKTIEALIKR